MDLSDGIAIVADDSDVGGSHRPGHHTNRDLSRR